MLEIRNLSAGVEGRLILKGINLSLPAGEVHAVMGPNGSGKSTLINVLAGLVHARVGEIRLGSTRLTDLSAPQRVAAGVAFVLPAGFAAAMPALGTARAVTASVRHAIRPIVLVELFIGSPLRLDRPLRSRCQQDHGALRTCPGAR